MCIIMIRSKIEDMFNIELEERSLEEVLEDFDITPVQALMILYSLGHIDEEVLERYAVN